MSTTTSDLKGIPVAEATVDLMRPPEAGTVSVLVVTAVAFLLLLLGGCATTSDLTDKPLPEPVYTAAPEKTTGSLYDNQGGLWLFGDQRARNVGDVLTVVLQERTSATKSASTSTTKNQSIGIDVPNFFGQVPVPENFSAEVGSDRGFEGSGNTSQSNQLSGQLTVQVVERLNGGILRIAGKKRLRLNQGVETLQLTGLVRPEDISPDNTVPSHRIANADISYSGRGAVADSNAQGWLARFFSSPLWPL